MKTPTEFKYEKELKFYCQKILPLVYDDSLSYYEVLCKIVHKLNVLIDNNNILPELIREEIRKYITPEAIEELLEEIFDDLRANIAIADEHDNVTASDNRTAGDWVWLNDELYVVLRDMDIGDAYIIGDNNPNVAKTTVEERVKYISNLLDNEITEREAEDTRLSGLIDDETTARENADTTLSGLIDDETTARENADTALSGLIDDETIARENADTAINDKIGNLSNLTTTEKTTLVGAINELDGEIGDLSNLTTTEKRTLVGAINEVDGDVGDLSTLETTDKSSTVDAINEVYHKVTTDIETALEQVQKDIEVRTEDIFNIKSLDLDWTQDITDAIEEVMQTHKRLYFPEGHYRFNITITDQDYEIWGDGWQRTYFHPVSDACITLDARNGVNCGDTYLHDFAIVGSSRNYDGIRTKGEYDTDPINNCLFKNIFINDCYIGVHWNSRGIWCVFDHVWCYGNYRGMYVHLDNTCAFNHNSFTDCLFGYNMTQGVYILGQADYKVNTNQFVHCTFERNWLQGHTSSDFSNVFIYNNATSFLDCYIEGEDGAADFYVRNGDLTFRGGCSLVPRGTFVCIADASSYVFIFGLHGFDTGNYKLTDSGSYNNHCYIIGSAISHYQMNSAYVQY